MLDLVGFEAQQHGSNGAGYHGNIEQFLIESKTSERLVARLRQAYQAGSSYVVFGPEDLLFSDRFESD